jgi:hypothetical protein
LERKKRILNGSNVVHVEEIDAIPPLRLTVRLNLLTSPSFLVFLRGVAEKGISSQKRNNCVVKGPTIAVLGRNKVFVRI